MENCNINIPRCHHLRVDGRQCGSPALRGKRLCYFHGRYRVLRRPKGLPLLEDPNSIQLMLMQVMRGLIEKSFDQKTAGLLFYGLQTAMANSLRCDFQPFPWDVIRDLHGAIPSDAIQEEVNAIEEKMDKEEAEAAEDETAAPFRAKLEASARRPSRAPKSRGESRELGVSSLTKRPPRSTRTSQKPNPQPCHPEAEPKEPPFPGPLGPQGSSASPHDDGTAKDGTG